MRTGRRGYEHVSYGAPRPLRQNENGIKITRKHTDIRTTARKRTPDDQRL